MALIDVLLDTSKRLDFVLYVEGTNRAGTTTGFYFSCCGRRPTAAHANPGNATMPPLLINPGAFSRGLSADSQFGGVSEASARNIVLRNDPNSPAHLHWMGDYTWERNRLSLYGGERGAAWSTFEEIHRTTIRANPRIRPRSVEFEPATPFDSLLVGHPVTKFIGQETAVDGAIAASHFASGAGLTDYSRTAFTAVARVRYTPAASATISDRMFMVLDDATGKEVFGFDAVGSTPGTYLPRAIWNRHLGGTTGVSLAVSAVEEGLWQTWVFSIRRNGTGYFAIDDEYIEFSDASPFPSPAVTIEVARSELAAAQLFEVMDVRYYGAFITRDDSHSILAEPATTDDALVSNWKFDDGPAGGTNYTATDYGPAGNDILCSTGVSPNDFWVASGEGDEHVRGKTKLYAMGEARQVPAPFLSNIWKQYHLPSVGGTHGAVDFRERDAIIYDELDAEVDMNRALVTLTGSLPLEPTTADPDLVVVGGVPLTLGGLLTQIFTEAGLTIDDVGAAEVDSIIGGLNSALVVDDDPTTADLVAQTAEGAGIFIARNTDGKFRPGFLRPSLSPTPHSKPCMDFRGIGKAVFASGGDLSGDFTLCAWFKSQNLSSYIGDVVSTLTYGRELIFAIDGTSSDAVLLTLTGRTLVFEILDFGTLSVYHWEADLDGLIENQDNFVAVSFDRSTLEVKLYQGTSTDDFDELVQGTSATSGTLGSVSNTATWIGNRFPGAVYHAATFGSVLTQPQLLDIMFRSASDIITYNSPEFFAPMNEGSGTPQDIANVEDGVVTYAVWDPTFKVHLKRSDTEFPETQLLAASQVTRMLFDRNWAPMEPAGINLTQLTSDLGANAAQTEYINAQKEYRGEVAIIRKTGRMVREFFSVITDGYRSTVARLTRLLDQRFRGKVVVETRSMYRPLLVAKEGDTLWLQGPGPGFNRLRSFRIVSAEPDLRQGSTGIAAWGDEANIAADEAAAEAAGSYLVDSSGNFLVDSSGNKLATMSIPTW